ncbi:MAG: hypothetical protein WCJ09_11235 [Planctomycetota bacterium]
MNHPNLTGPDDWRNYISLSIRVVGLVSLLFGVVVGGLQTFFHVALYDQNARGVTLESVYAIFFLWCFWGAVSIGYIVSAMLASHDIRSGIFAAAVFAAAVFALGHIAAIILIFTELGWL